MNDWKAIALMAQGAIILAMGVYIHLLRSGLIRVKFLFSAHLSEVAKLYDVMRIFTQETGIERLLIFKTSNGGAKPQLGMPLHISCVYEGPGTNVKEKYRHVGVDEEYVRLLLDIKQKGQMQIIAEDMPFGILQKMYLAEGIRYSCIFFIKENEESFYFGSIATKGENPFMDVKKDVAIQLTIDSIRDIFKKLKK